jgi:hypothetical protein
MLGFNLFGYNCNNSFANFVTILVEKINLVLALSLNFKGQRVVLHSFLFRKNAI